MCGCYSINTNIGGSDNGQKLWLFSLIRIGLQNLAQRALFCVRNIDFMVNTLCRRKKIKKITKIFLTILQCYFIAFSQREQMMYVC